MHGMCSIDASLLELRTHLYNWNSFNTDGCSSCLQQAMQLEAATPSETCTYAWNRRGSANKDTSIAFACLRHFVLCRAQKCWGWLGFTRAVDGHPAVDLPAG